MSITRNLLRGPITYSSAVDKEANILHELSYVAAAVTFKDHIENNKSTIKTIVARHLRLSPSKVTISDRSEWLNGSFNLCVPACVQERQSRRVIIRFPLPYKTGGNGDEKIRCEAATYAWIDQMCPSIPITCLHGFGLSTGQTFTLLKDTSVFTRCIEYLRRQVLSLLRYPVPCQYVRQREFMSPNNLGVGYLLLDYVEDGKMLSETYLERIDDKNSTRKFNLFHDLAKIQLTLFQKPLPRIGSLIINDNATISLTNRPVTVDVCILENQKIPTDMPQNRTYSTIESYVRDLLFIHDNRLRYQPNGVTSSKDGITQMAALATMRTICSDFFDRKLQHGPFVLTLTDLHASNFFVDDDWHITKVIDLEWACIRPLEMQHPPYWLTNEAVDIIDENLYGKLRQDYMTAFQQEEEKLANGLFYTKLLNRLWETGTFWYCLALDSITGICQIFNRRLKSKYSILDESAFEDRFYFVAPTFWCINAWKLIRSKAKQKKEYDEDLQQAFQVPRF
ncbi:hypothetical protein EMCG_00143 [[Emmonsia] crescens]|uniref:Aminoglycoside phosphotransferase domain-containing protein n=1 Tax=[Emmonsia] crescens TaxID=73230 RepID=A0A0G2J823_9EURO|nr:hypothetical protein EMCG_00143 [Emmonsia crescens UAMH 3008]